MHKSPGLLIVMFLGLLVAWTPASADALGLTTFKSRRYQVFTDLEMAQARSVASHLDKVYDEYESRLAKAGFSGASSPPMPLYLIRTEQKYLQVLASMDVNGAGTAGIFFYSGGQARLAGWLTHGSESQLIETLQHEGFHQFAFLKISRNLPVWVNEGLAVYFQQGLLIGNRMVLNQVDGRRLALLKQVIDENRHLPFEQLLNMTDAQWLERVNRDDGAAGLMYVQSWSIVHFLVNAERGKYEKPFMEYLRLIHTGFDSRRAFMRAFGSTEYSPFEQAWRKYITELGPDAIALGAQRARFLAEGMAKLTESGVKIETMDRMKTDLQKIKFESTTKLEHWTTTLSATDDVNFEPPNERGKVGKWVLTPAKDEALPPMLSLTGLQATVNVIWSRNPDAQLNYTIELK